MPSAVFKTSVDGCRMCRICSRNSSRYGSRISVYHYSPDGAHSDEGTPDPSQAIYAEFDDDFEEEELTAPIGQCTALYNFPGRHTWKPRAEVN